MKMRDFLIFSKVTAKEAAISYFEPLKWMIGFFGVIVEMLRQGILSMIMTSDDFKKLQDLKLLEEIAELSNNGLSTEEVEKEL